LSNPNFVRFVPDNFVDEPEKLYRLSRCEAQAKKLDFVDLKVEEGSSESPKDHHLKALGRINFHQWENNRKSARSGSYAP
jgi:hypothetical protein